MSSTYIDHVHIGRPRGDGGHITHSWAEHTLIALRWHYPDRAKRIAKGTDPATLADLARWNALGRRDAA